MCCLLVVLVKLSVRAKWLARKICLCPHSFFFCVSLSSWVISLTVLGASVTNLNEPPRALAASTIAWVLGHCKQKQRGLRGLLCRWPSITEWDWEVHITARGPRLRNDLYCVEWDVTLYYTSFCVSYLSYVSSWKSMLKSTSQEWCRDHSAERMEAISELNDFFKQLWHTVGVMTLHHHHVMQATISRGISVELCQLLQTVSSCEAWGRQPLSSSVVILAVFCSPLAGTQLVFS